MAPPLTLSLSKVVTSEAIDKPCPVTAAGRLRRRQAAGGGCEAQRFEDAGGVGGDGKTISVTASSD